MNHIDPHDASKLSSENTLSPEENEIKLQFVIKNINHICRFCLSISSTKMNLIFDESSQQSIDNSVQLLDKINFTLYNQVSSLLIASWIYLIFNLVQIPNRVDCKVSNLICESCSSKVESFFKFRKQCELSSQLLNEASNEIQKHDLKVVEQVNPLVN